MSHSARYEWANFPALKARNEAAGISQEIIDKVEKYFLLHDATL